jgi:GTPase SAR1 family protein
LSLSWLSPEREQRASACFGGRRSLTRRRCAQKAHAWVRELQKHATPGCVITLVGNKRDLEAEREARPSCQNTQAQHNTQHAKAHRAALPQPKHPFVARIGR